MGLFSNKKTQADGFSFAVDEVYALKEGKSVVVTGKMTEGKVTPGTAAICLDSEGKLAFHCVIEQGTQLMKMASADMKGTYGPHYGFKLDGAVKEDVPKGAVLVPVTDELLEVVSETEEPAFKATPAPKVIDFNRISGLTMEDLQGVPEENENDLEAVKKAGILQEKTKAKYPFLIPDTTMMNGRLQGISAFPETFFVDKDGNIVGDTYTGSHTLDEWKEIVEKELKNVSK